MLEQFIKSVMAFFVKTEPMNAYVQNIPNGVKYPCYFLNKCDLKTHTINAFYYLNTVTLHVRVFSENEIELKNQVFNLINAIFETQRKIPILDTDGNETERYIRLEDIESIEIPVDENDLYCIEVVFNFDTTHNITAQEFDLLGSLFLSENYIGGEE